jgi:hypothetical protein
MMSKPRINSRVLYRLERRHNISAEQVREALANERKRETGPDDTIKVYGLATSHITGNEAQFVMHVYIRYIEDSDFYVLAAAWEG